MRVLPLGGAGEVGASSALLELRGARVLIDAGVRTASAGRARPLPAYEHLGPAPDAVLITHAHTDHTGSLPLVAERTGGALIHMTTPTLHLFQILQGDALRDRRPEELAREAAVVMTKEQVDQAIAHVVAHGYHAPFTPVPGRGDIVVEYAPCGHILGAGVLLIDTPEERIVWTGDYSVAPQPTIGGLDLAWLAQRAAERPVDLLVTEGTYGTAEHPSRAAETERFLALLEQTTAEGGRVLIPAFAVGRAQDVVHVIRAAKLAGRLAGIPVYLDGMVRPVTSIYENLAHESYAHLEGPLTLVDRALDIFKANAQSRARLLAGDTSGPAIVISSSGMLVGGRSVEYARSFAQDPRAAILLSGYQDEESPGHQLLTLRRGGELRLPNDHGGIARVRVACQVGRYHTSAHADVAQIRAVVAAVQPRHVALVHGDPAALSALHTQMDPARSTVLVNGEPFLLPARRRRYRAPVPPRASSAASPSQRPMPPALPNWRPPTEAVMRSHWERLLALGDREYAEPEIAHLMLGAGYAPSQREALASSLADHRLYFLSGSRMGQRTYRPRPRDEVIERLIERGHAHQLPLTAGDVVVFSDGSPDLFLAVMLESEGDVMDAVIPFSPRTQLRRDWVRCRTGVNLQRSLDRQSAAHVLRWLEGLVREARALPALNIMDAYVVARAQQDRLTVEEALAVFFPRRDGLFSGAMRVAAGLALAGARALFTLGPEGTFLARTPAEAAIRWRAFPRIWHVRTAGPGASITLAAGQCVLPTGVFYPESFEARTADGHFTRASYRRVVLPDECATTDTTEGGDGALEPSSNATVAPAWTSPAPCDGTVLPSDRRRRRPADA